MLIFVAGRHVVRIATESLPISELRYSVLAEYLKYEIIRILPFSSNSHIAAFGLTVPGMACCAQCNQFREELQQEHHYYPPFHFANI